MREEEDSQISLVIVIHSPEVLTEQNSTPCPPSLTSLCVRGCLWIFLAFLAPGKIIHSAFMVRWCHHAGHDLSRSERWQVSLDYITEAFQDSLLLVWWSNTGGNYTTVDTVVVVGGMRSHQDHCCNHPPHPATPGWWAALSA